MNARQVQEINNWIATCQKLQPEASLAIFVYVRDGLVQIGRGDQPLELRSFPTIDLPAVRDKLVDVLNAAFERGPTEGVPRDEPAAPSA